MTTTGTLYVENEQIPYTLNEQKEFAKETLYIAECAYQGGVIVGEPRKTRRAAEASLKRAVARRIETDAKAALERQRIERWNAGLPKAFDGEG